MGHCARPCGVTLGFERTARLRDLPGISMCTSLTSGGRQVTGGEWNWKAFCHGFYAATGLISQVFRFVHVRVLRGFPRAFPLSQ
jgi:hypothetical protein